MAAKANKNSVGIHPIYSPRTSYKRIKDRTEKMIADMTLNFDKLTINLLREYFKKKDDELTLHEFITIAKRHLKFWQVSLPNREDCLVRYLTKLFNEIDINGNGDMEWYYFTNYIIEKATVLKNLKSKNDEIKQYVKSDIRPKMRLDGLIQKVEYLTDVDKVAYFEEGSNTISFINAETGYISTKDLVVTPKNLVINISSVRKEKDGKTSIKKKDLVLPTSIRVLDMLYIPEKKFKVLLVSTSDGYVRGWKHSQNGYVLATQPDNEEELFEHHFRTEIYCLAWDHINEVLYCGQKNGSIILWNLKTDLEMVLHESRNAELDHEGPEEKVNMLITSMITMPKLQFMASGRMDGKLILWDTINSNKKWVYREHTRGILSLAFHYTMILLFSAGFDHKICIWNPYISTLIHKIYGHLSPVLTLKIVDGTNQLISMDSYGIIKVTDTRRFNILSSFSVDTDAGRAHNQSGNVSSFIAINKPSKQAMRLIFAGKSLIMYDYDKNYNPHCADEYTSIGCRYIKYTLSFFTPSANKIKVWSALNGDVYKIFLDLTAHEISCFDFDFLEKRIVVGDSKGNITLFNKANGAKMKSLTKHSGEVTHLIATQNTDTKVDIFISCGLDNEIRISRETYYSFEVVRTIFLKKEVEVTCLYYYLEAKLIIVGTNVGTLSFFDIYTGKNVGACLSDNNEEYTSISKTKDEIAIATTSTGCIHLIGIPPFPYHYEKMLTFVHKNCYNEVTPLGIRLSRFDTYKKKLYIVDDKMYLTCYCFSEMFTVLNYSDISKYKLYFERRNIIRNIFHHNYIKKKWHVKVHLETVKALELISEYEIIITSSFDKKVKIWNANTGDYIDSLEQNYNKEVPYPLGYYDSIKNILYTEDRKKAFPHVTIVPGDLNFDPFLCRYIVKGRYYSFQKKISNHYWKLQIKFKDVVRREKEYYGKILSTLEEGYEQYTTKIEPKYIEYRKKDILERKRKMMQYIYNTELFPERIPVCKENVAQKRERKITKNYYRRSMMKCIKNFVAKCEQSDTKKEDTPQKKKYVDYVPIYETVSKKQQSKEELIEHRKFIFELAKKETLSIINSRETHQISLSKNETDAANKLYSMLRKTNGSQRADEVKFNYKDNIVNQVKMKRNHSVAIRKSIFYKPHTAYNSLPHLY